MHRAFGGLPLFEAPLLTEEPAGPAALATFARDVSCGRDPAEVMNMGSTQRIVEQDDRYVLQLPMPNVEAGRLSLTKRGDALYIDVGNFRWEIALSASHAALEPGVARLLGGVLEMPFDANSTGGRMLPSLEAGAGR